jgi:hypothetical protein
VPEVAATNSIASTPGFVNCFFSWGKSGASKVFQTRCRGIAHGFDVIAEESHARQTRAFYPRQVADQGFVVTLELRGYQELQEVMRYLREYVQSFMNVTKNAMYVVIPARSFTRLGVPVGGIVDGDHVGSNVFLSSIRFESVYDPADPELVSKSHNTSQYSRFDASTSGADPAAKFFYPAAVSTNDPNASGDLLYGSDDPGKIGAGIADLLTAKSLRKGS